MGITRKIKRALRGELSMWAAALEAGRRIHHALRQRHEGNLLAKQPQPGECFEPNIALTPRFAAMNKAALVAHFRQRETPQLFEGPDLAPDEIRGFLHERSPPLIEGAQEILSYQWPLLGFGRLDFGAEIDWLRDPVSGGGWPLEYHGDIEIVRGDGSDVRVLWEQNRLGHLLRLAQAYVLSSDERFAEEFLTLDRPIMRPRCLQDQWTHEVRARAQSWTGQEIV